MWQKLRITDLAELLKVQMRKQRPKEEKCLPVVTWTAKDKSEVGSGPPGCQPDAASPACQGAFLPRMEEG